MTYLTLKASDEVRSQIVKFARIIYGYKIRITAQRENKEAGTIEITTDAFLVMDIRSVKAAAYDCFGDAIISFEGEAPR